MPYIDVLISKYAECTRSDGIWDIYVPDSLKNQIRITREHTSSRRNRVDDELPIPKGKLLQKFLSDSQNKSDLFPNCSRQLIKYTSNKRYQLLSTENEYVLSTGGEDIDLGDLQPCNHEEADTRMFLHVKHASANGHKIIMIRTVDTDIVVSAISFFSLT